jgi:hypothetical protein
MLLLLLLLLLLALNAVRSKHDGKRKAAIAVPYSHCHAYYQL